PGPEWALKDLPAEEKKAAQGPIEVLRPRVAALARSDVAPPRPQPVVPPQVSFPAQAVRQQLPMALNPIAGSPIEVAWGQRWWPASILQVQGTQYLIHYTGWAAYWDEWGVKARIRS